MRCSVQDIFREHFDSYAQVRNLHPRELRAAWCIRHCYGPELGGHVLACPEGHFVTVQYHACRHRTCPRCAQGPRQQWLAAQLPKLLPCAHFHVIFTLPHEFLALWQFNRVPMAQLLFDCARDSLLELCADPKFLGAMPGLLMALHTWGRTLSHHPHVHCLVSAGGLAPDNQWQATGENFFLPLKPLQALFRGKFLCALKHALRARSLQLPDLLPTDHWLTVITNQWRSHWNIEISKPYAHGNGVALYLARYVKGGPLANDHRLNLTDNIISFDYRDHRDGKLKTSHLTINEFISRLLWHAPPKGLRTVRSAGLYATAHRRQHQRCQQLLKPFVPPSPERPLASHTLTANRPPVLCPQCSKPLTLLSSTPSSHHSGDISLANSPPTPPPGPTGRCNGQTPAFHHLAARPPPVRRGSPLN